MEFDLQWLLLGLPIAFALGWLGSRLDGRQWRSDARESPRAYFKGLNLLLNEQQDKAIDAFIEAVQHDPDTSDLHFALGNLFRRRGEYERAVRVHQHLLGRADLPQADRDRAQHALAQDFNKAGLFDRAEEAFKALEGTAYRTESQIELLALYERSRGWASAIDVAKVLERSGAGSFATRISHYWCELALEAQARHLDSPRADALRHARESAPRAPRPLVLEAQRRLSMGDADAALAVWHDLLVLDPASFNVVVTDYVATALAADARGAALLRLQDQYRRTPTTELLRGIDALEAPADIGLQRERWRLHLARHATLSAASELLRHTLGAGQVPTPDEATALRDAVVRAATPAQRYRCAACGFETQHYFWQCPGCLGWDTYPPHRLEDQ